MKKRKSSEVLEDALKLLENNTWKNVCAAILDVELEVPPKFKSKAMTRFWKYKPEHIRDNMKQTQDWWSKGDPKRIETLKQCIEDAKNEND